MMARRKVSPLMIVAAVVLSIIVVAIIVPVQPHGESAMIARCTVHVKHLAMASLMYAEDYDDRFMDRDNWMDGIFPYHKVAEEEHCPALKGDDPEAESKLFGYAFNSNLSRTDNSKILTPTTEPLLYGSINLARNASDPAISLPDPPRMHGQNRSNIIAYADSHVKRLHPKEADQ